MQTANTEAPQFFGCSVFANLHAVIVWVQKVLMYIVVKMASILTSTQLTPASMKYQHQRFITRKKKHLYYRLL